MHCQKKHTRSSSWDQTACRALGSKGAERRDTWPAVNKEHPLWTTQQPGETHRQTNTYKCLHTKIHSHTRTYHTQRYNIYLPSEKMHILYSDRCAYNTTDTLYHASFTRYADKQTADSHNGCYRKSRPYSSSLSLSGESRNSQSKGSKAREWRSVWVSTNTQQKARKKKHQNMSEWIITIPHQIGRASCGKSVKTAV